MSLLASKVAAQCLLPPGGLVLLGVLGMFFRKRAWGRALVWLTLALTWALATEPVRDALTRPLEFHYPVLNTVEASAARFADAPTAIVLLGGGIYENAPEFGGQDELARHALARTVFAADLARRTGLPVYVTGGKALTHESGSEGAIMRRWLVRFGVPQGVVHAETAAANTWQNAVYLQRVLEPAGIRRIVLVTSAWHMPRSVWCFERQGMKVIPAPTDYFTRMSAYDERSWFPRWNTFAESCEALHEYLGLLWYRLRHA